MLYSIIKPLLFLLDAEQAHNVALSSMNRFSCCLPSTNMNTNPVTVMGIDFPNKVGLAAGLDKNGTYISALGKLGFGAIEVGTVTPRPQMGNPKPRLFRLKEKEAIINRMGFNNDGLESLIHNVKQSRYKGVLGINIGKNKDTPNDQAIQDYLTCLTSVYPFADYITANISSPNTKGLRELQNSDNIKRLINALKEKQQQLVSDFGYKPIAIKIAPDLSDDAITSLAHIFLEHEIDGVIATNTTVDKSSVNDHLFGREEGGLSGAPLRVQSNHVIKLLSAELSGKIPIIGVGGILSVKHAQEKIDAGADLIQVYSGLIYHGPQIVKDLVKGIK